MDATLAATKILGTWRLLSFDLVSDEATGSKPLAQPLGPSPLGRIMFNSDGFMSCTLTHPDRAKPLGSKAPWSMASDEDIAFVARALTTYCGSYKIYLEGSEIRLATDVEIALDPSWIGTAQVRRVLLCEEAGKQTLVLRPVQYLALPDGTKALGVLAWEKMESAQQIAKCEQRRGLNIPEQP